MTCARRARLAVPLGALASCVLLGVLAVGLPRATATDEQVLCIASGAPVRTLDPHEVTGQIEHRIGEALFEGLTFLDPATLLPRAGVAEDWTISPDGRTYTFRLRAEARFGDGRAVTAQDFAWSWRRLMEPDRQAPLAYLLHGIRGARALNRYGVDADRILGTPAEPDALIAQVRQLAARSAGSVDALTWRRFVASSGLAETVRGTKEAVLHRALRLETGALDRGALDAVQKALRVEAWRRRAAHQGADAGFGTTLGVRALDERTLVVELEVPQPWFLELLASPVAAPLPRHVLAGVENEWTWWSGPDVVGNGPFRLAARGPGGRLRLERSATYWNPEAIRLDGVDLVPIADGAQALARFRRGELDWSLSWPYEQREALQGEPFFRARPGHVVYFYRLNCTHPVLKDVDVRKALALCLHRPSLVERVRGKGALPTGRIVPPRMRGYTPPEAEQRFELERARFLLAQAGFPGGAGIEPLTLVYNTSEAHARMASAFADEVRRRLGVPVRPVNAEWQLYRQRVDALEYAISRGGWIGDYQDPSTFLEMWTSDSPDNDTGWTNARYDRLLAAARDMEAAERDPERWLSALAEPEPAARLLAKLRTAKNERWRRARRGELRMLLLREAETILVADEVPVIPLYVYEQCDLVQPHVKGFFAELTLRGRDGRPLPNGLGLHPLRGVWLER